MRGAADAVRIRVVQHRTRPLIGAASTVLAALVVGLFVAVAPAAAAPPPQPSAAQIAAAQASRRADVAALGTIAGQIAAIDGELARTQAALDTAIAKYNAITRAVQLALADTTAKNAELDAARTGADRARADAVLQLRQSFMVGTRESGANLVVSDGPAAVLIGLDVQRYVSLRKSSAVADLTRARVNAANAEAAAQIAEQSVRSLQAAAATQRDTVIGSLRAAQARRQQMQIRRAVLDRQAAITYGRLQGLLTQQAAYRAWAAEQARLRAAEALRQAALARAAADAAAAAATPVAASTSVVLAPASGGTWGNPMAAGSYSISSCFCARWGTFHWGVDFAAPLGTPIYAVGAGTVVAAGPAQGFGNWVVIDHGTGELSVYGHMRLMAVTAGQQVRRGQLIAWVGAEGESTGPHLHLEIRLGGIDGTKIDPQIWLAQRGVFA